MNRYTYADYNLYIDFNTDIPGKAFIAYLFPCGNYGYISTAIAKYIHKKVFNRSDIKLVYNLIDKALKNS